MVERVLGRILIFGTIAFLIWLAYVSVNSVSLIENQRTAPLNDQIVAGKKVWQQKICQDCHTLLGIGGYLAPELTKEAQRRDAAFLTGWLKDPQAVKPGTTMPNQHLDDQQVANVVAFFQWVNQIDTNNWPPAPPGAPQASAGSPQGALLFQQKGCIGCHMINGQGAPGPGPDLSHIGSQPYDQLSNTPDFLYQWIENPKAIKPTTIMPVIPMTPEERLAIVQYLISLQ